MIKKKASSVFYFQSVLIRHDKSHMNTQGPTKSQYTVSVVTAQVQLVRCLVVRSMGFIRPVFTGNILTCHCRKSTGETNFGK